MTRLLGMAAQTRWLVTYLSWEGAVLSQGCV